MIEPTGILLLKMTMAMEALRRSAYLPMPNGPIPLNDKILPSPILIGSMPYLA